MRARSRASQGPVGPHKAGHPTLLDSTAPGPGQVARVLRRFVVGLVRRFKVKTVQDPDSPAPLVQVPRCPVRQPVEPEVGWLVLWPCPVPRIAAIRESADWSRPWQRRLLLPIAVDALAQQA